jgi:proline iminopeptidase
MPIRTPLELFGGYVMLWKVLKFLGISIACLLVLVPTSLLLYRKLLQYQVSEHRAIHSPNGIDSLEAVQIGGMDQWIEVRGQNVNNPILLFIHGGPGIAFIPLAGAFQDPWEQYFTVVQWDQRGAGKTYASSNKELLPGTMSVERMEQDTLEVVNYLRSRFHREKIFVLGHSWGSVLGLWLAHEHPEFVYAYVGVGQIVDIPQNTEAMREDALHQARENHNQQAIQDLEGIGSRPPQNSDTEKMFVANKWAGELLGPPPNGTSFTDIRRIAMSVVSAPEYSLRDDLGFFRGQMFSLNTMLPQVARLNLKELGSEFHVPVFFFEGRDDQFCRPALIWDYSQTIQAPQKGFVWFERSGHFPFFEEPQKFKEELVRQVLPVASGVAAVE